MLLLHFYIIQCVEGPALSKNSFLHNMVIKWCNLLLKFVVEGRLALYLIIVILLKTVSDRDLGQAFSSGSSVIYTK